MNACKKNCTANKSFDFLNAVQSYEVIEDCTKNCTKLYSKL